MGKAINAQWMAKVLRDSGERLSAEKLDTLAFVLGALAATDAYVVISCFLLV